MLKREWLFRIEDILNAIRNTREIVENIDFDTFRTVVEKWSGAAFHVIIIGEAVRYLPKEVKEHYPNIPWNDIYGMRNRIVHDYRRINFNVLWDTIHNDLPTIHQQLEEILQEYKKD